VEGTTDKKLTNGITSNQNALHSKNNKYQPSETTYRMRVFENYTSDKWLIFSTCK
jgi:hypothetical protein